MTLFSVPKHLYTIFPQCSDFGFALAIHSSFGSFAMGSIAMPNNAHHAPRVRPLIRAQEEEEEDEECKRMRGSRGRCVCVCVADLPLCLRDTLINTRI